MSRGNLFILGSKCQGHGTQKIAGVGFCILLLVWNIIS